MKSTGIFVFILTLVTCFGENPKNIMIEKAPNVDLAGTLPEEYNWLGYIADAESVSDEMTRAWSGIKYLEPRLQVIHEECRAILKNREQDLQIYEKMYALWIQADEVEVSWVSQTYEGGSQQRAAVPRAKLRTLIRRIQVLRELKKNSDLFNQ